MTRQRWRLVIHGGAGSMRPAHGSIPSMKRCARDGLERRAGRGRGNCSQQAASALDAVEAAVRVARGGSLLQRRARQRADRAGRSRARRGDHGRTRPARRGGVRASRTTRAPISLARRLMEHGPHVFLSGHGADDFARERRPRAGRQRLVRYSRNGGASSRSCWPRAGSTIEVKYGTVGAVAVDADGHVAAATSTGGLTAKRWGRVGDSPLIGAGTYADDRSAAVSATGSGEYFIRAVAAHQLAERDADRRRDRCSRRSTPCSPTSTRSAARAG